MTSGDHRSARRHRAGLLCLLFLVALAALLFLAEGAARVFLAAPAYVLGRDFDPDLGFAQQPHLEVKGFHDPEGEFDYRTNAEGFRGPELPAPGETHPPGTRRLLFLGDSMLDGFGVRLEALIPFSCEAELRARGHAVQASNVSNSAFGTAQELLLFRQHCKRIDPDIVVLVLFTGNDLVDNAPELVGHTTVSPGAYVRPYLVADEHGGLETLWLNPLRAALRRRSRLYQNIEMRLLAFGFIHDPSSLDLVPSQWECIDAGRLPRTYLEVLLPPEPGGPWAAGWKRTEDLLRAFRREVESSGARFVLTSIPDSFQVERAATSHALDSALLAAHKPTLGERVDWNLPEKRLAGFAEVEGFDYVPLLDALRAETKEARRSCYFVGGHLSALGHRAAGRALASALEPVLAGGSPPSDPLRSSQPVDLLDSVFAAAGRVDFAEDWHSEVLIWNWRKWAPVGKSGAAGWDMSGARASLYAPAQTGTLIVDLWALQPGLKVSLSVQGRAAKLPLTVKDSGPFELKAPIRRLSPEDSSVVLVELALAGKEPSPDQSIIVTGLRYE